MCAQKNFRIVMDERLLYVSHSPPFQFGGTITAILPCKMVGERESRCILKSPERKDEQTNRESLRSFGFPVGCGD